MVRLNLRARQYEPAQMRFSQRDLLKGDASEPLSLNRYLYCENDGVNFADPSGMNRLGDLINKAKTVASSAATAVTRVVTNTVKAVTSVVHTVVNTVKTVASAVTQTAQKIVNTVQSVVNTARTSGVKAAINQAVSSAKAAPAYLANTYTAAKAEIQANIAQSAKEIIDLKKDTAAAFTDFITETYGELSPRNQEIMSNAAAKMKEMQANGASETEIATVFLTACREVGKNVGETTAEAVKEEIVKPTVETVKEEIVKPTIEAVISAAKNRVSYNDDDTTAFGLVKLGIGGYVGSVVGGVAGNPIFGAQIAADITKYLNENPFTISVGGQFSIAAGGAVDSGIMATLDSNGYVAMQHFGNWGGGSPNASLGGLLMITNAPSYKNLTDNIPAMNYGGSYSAVVSAGGDYVVIPSGEIKGGYYSGLSVSVGIGSSLLPPIPAEIHAVASETETFAAWDLN